MKRIPEFGRQPGDLPLGKQVLFNDGKVGILWGESGDAIDSSQLSQLGLDASAKPGTMMRIETQGGNNYVLTQGLAINKGKNTVGNFNPVTAAPVEVGKQWSAPDGETTEPVTAVFYGDPTLEDRAASPVTADLTLDGVPDVRVEQPSPYAETQDLVQRIREAYPNRVQ